MSEENYADKQIEKYGPAEVKIAELEAEFMKVKVLNPDDMGNYMRCKSGHQEVKSVIAGVEENRIVFGRTVLALKKKIDDKAMVLTLRARKIADHLKTQRDIVEAEKKRKVEAATLKKKEEEDLRKKEEADRQEEIRKDNEAKSEELRIKEEKIKADQLAIDKEKERLAKEKEDRKREKEDREREEKDAEQAEIDRIEREKKHKEEIARAEEQAVQDEQKRQEEAKKEKIRIKQEEEMKAEHERQAAPDREKLVLLSQTIAAIKLPEVEGPEAKGILFWAKESIEKLVEELKNPKL